MPAFAGCTQCGCPRAKSFTYLLEELPDELSELVAPEPVVGIEVEPAALDPLEDGTAVLEVGAVPLGFLIVELPLLSDPELDEAVPDEVVPDVLLPVEEAGLFIEPHAASTNAHAKGRIHLIIKYSLESYSKQANSLRPFIFYVHVCICIL